MNNVPTYVKQSLSHNANVLANILYCQFTTNKNFDEFSDFSIVPLSPDDLNEAISELEKYELISVEYDDNNEMYLYIHHCIITYKEQGMLKKIE